MEDLDEPRTLDCLMIKAPLKKVQKNYTTVIFMWFLMLLVYITSLLFIFPLYQNKEIMITTLLSLFVFTFLTHMVTMCKNPGYLKKPTDVQFMAMLEYFDPVLLCPDC